MADLERYFLALSRLAPPVALTMVVDHQGAPLEEGALRAAVEAVAMARSDVRLRLDGDGSGAEWRCDGPLPAVMVHERPLVGPLGAVDAEAMQQAVRLEPEAGPGLSVHAMPGVSGGGRLVLRGCHAHIDGRGLVLVLKDLLTALRGERVAPTPLGPPQHTLAIEPPTEEGEGRSPFGPPQAPGRPGMHHLHRSLGPLVRPLQAVVRAAVEVATTRGLSAGQIRVGVPTDLRRHDAGLARAAGNLTGVLYHHGPDAGDLQARIEAGEDRRELAHDVPLRGMTIAEVTRLTRESTSREIDDDEVERSMMVSNLGRLELSALDLPGRRATGRHWLPPDSGPVPLFLGLIGDGDGVELGATIPARWVDAAGAARFVDEICDRLAAGR